MKICLKSYVLRTKKDAIGSLLGGRPLRHLFQTHKGPVNTGLRSVTQNPHTEYCWRLHRGATQTALGVAADTYPPTQDPPGELLAILQLWGASSACKEQLLAALAHRGADGWSRESAASWFILS